MTALTRAMDGTHAGASVQKSSSSDTWYAAALPAERRRPRLDRDVTCDVAVVGGGFLGLSTALHLAERGLDVVLLEAGRIGDGASGRNGGLVLPGFAATNGEVAAASDPETARRLWTMTVDGVETVKALVADHAIACDLKTGVLTAAAAPGHARRLARDAGDLRRDYGYGDLEVLSAGEARALVRSERYSGGVLDRRAAHLNPLALARGLAEAAETAGARLFEATAVTRVMPGDRPVVETALGRVRARSVVLAANVAIGDLAPTLRRTVLPLTTYMVATEPMGAERAARVLPTGVAVYDTEVELNYFRMSSDHRLLFGSGVTVGAREPAWIRRHLGRAMTAIFPQLADLALDHAWSGRLDVTANRTVQAGNTDNVWFAQGFSGHGVALTVRTGRAIADALTGRGDDMALLGRLRHKPIPAGRRLAPLTLPIRILVERLRQAVRPDAFYTL